MKFSWAISIAGALALAAFSVPANAVVKTFDFYGTISSSDEGLSSGAYVGQHFNGQISYDPDTLPSFEYGIQDNYYNAVDVSYTSPAGSASGTGYITVLHPENSSYDSFNIFAFTTGDFYLAQLSTLLPATPIGSPLPNDLNGLTFEFSNEGKLPGTDIITAFQGTATIGVAAVPEPASWAMMIGGIGIAGGVMRRRQRPALLATA